MAGGTSFADAIPILDWNNITCVCTVGQPIWYYSFVPQLSATVSVRASGTVDNYAYLYDHNQAQLTYNDDSGGNMQFWMTWAVTAGQTYYIRAQMLSGGAGTFPFAVTNVWLPTMLSAAGNAVCSAIGSINMEMIPTPVSASASSSTTCSATSNLVNVIFAPVQGAIACSTSCVVTPNLVNVLFVYVTGNVVCTSNVYSKTFIYAQASSTCTTTGAGLYTLFTIIPLCAFGRSPCTSAVLGNVSIALPVKGSVSCTSVIGATAYTYLSIAVPANVSGSCYCNTNAYLDPEYIDPLIQDPTNVYSVQYAHKALMTWLPTSASMPCAISPGKTTAFGFTPTTNVNAILTSLNVNVLDIEYTVTSPDSNPNHWHVGGRSYGNGSVNIPMTAVAGQTMYVLIRNYDPTVGSRTIPICITFDSIPPSQNLLAVCNATVKAIATMTGLGTYIAGSCTLQTIATATPAGLITTGLGTTPISGSVSCSTIGVASAVIAPCSCYAFGTSTCLTSTVAYLQLYVTTIGISGSVVCSTTVLTDSYVYTPIINTANVSGTAMCSSTLVGTLTLVVDTSAAVSCSSLTIGTANVVMVIFVNIVASVNCITTVSGTTQVGYPLNNSGHCTMHTTVRGLVEATLIVCTVIWQGPVDPTNGLIVDDANNMYFDRWGHLWLSMEHRSIAAADLYKMDSKTGAILGTYGCTIRTGGYNTFSDVIDIVVDHEGICYIAWDTYMDETGALQKMNFIYPLDLSYFSFGGSIWFSNYDSSSYAYNTTLDSDENLVFQLSGWSTVIKASSDTSLIMWQRPYADFNITGDPTVKIGIVEMKLSASGMVLLYNVSDMNGLALSSGVATMDTNGNIISNTRYTDFWSCRNLALDLQGNRYVLAYSSTNANHPVVGSSVIKIAPSGAEVWSAPLTANCINIASIGVDPRNGAVWIGNFASGLQYYDPFGNPTFYDYSIYGIGDIHVDEIGDLYVCNISWGTYIPGAVIKLRYNLPCVCTDFQYGYMLGLQTGLDVQLPPRFSGLVTTPTVDFKNGLLLGTITATNRGPISTSSVWQLNDIGYASAVSVDATGNVYVTYANSSGINLRKLDKNGNVLWSKSDCGPAIDVAVSLFMSIVWVAYSRASSNLRMVDPTTGTEMYMDATVESNLCCVIADMPFLPGWGMACNYLPAGHPNFREMSSAQEFSRTLYSYPSKIVSGHGDSNSDSRYGRSAYLVLNSGTTLLKYNSMSGLPTDTVYWDSYILWIQNGYTNITGLAMNGIDFVCICHGLPTGSVTVRSMDATGLTLWTNSDVGNAVAIAIDGANNVYVAYNNPIGHKSVRAFDPTGQEIWSLSDSANATDICVDSIGYVYVTYANPAGQPNIRKLYPAY